MHPRRPALRRAVAGALGAVLLLSSCSTGGDDPRATPSPSPATPAATGSATGSAGSETTAASPSAEPSAPEPPEPPQLPPVPRPRPGPQGQLAFARYVMAAWAWSLQANDARPLLEASRSARRPCRGCAALERELRTRDREGWYVALPALGVGRTRLRRDGDEVVATSRVDVPESDTYFYDGSFRSTSLAHDDASFVVRMRQAEDRYVLVSFTVG